MRASDLELSLQEEKEHPTKQKKLLHRNMLNIIKQATNSIFLRIVISSIRAEVI